MAQKRKYPWMKFHIRDWLSDPAVRRLSPSSRGIWIDILAFIFEEEDGGAITATPEELARMTGSTQAEMDLFLQEADVTNLSRVTWRDNEVTLVNRRMEREEKGKEISRLTSKRCRAKKARDTLVTGESQKQSQKQKKKGTPPAAVAAPSPTVFQGKYFEVTEEKEKKLLEEYKGIPSREWLKRFFSKIDDYIGDHEQKYKRDAKGKVKSPSSIIRNWLERETFQGGGTTPPTPTDTGPDAQTLEMQELERERREHPERFVPGADLAAVIGNIGNPNRKETAK